MSRIKVSTTMYITAKQDESLRALSRRTRVPISVYIREGIDMVLAKYGEDSGSPPAGEGSGHPAGA